MDEQNLNTMKYQVRRWIIPIILVLFGNFFDSMAQSGFSVVHGESDAISYTYGELFYRQYGVELSVNEGVEQSYLICDTLIDDGCAGVAYSNYGVEYGDTLQAGLYVLRRYSHAARYGYDSLMVHRLMVYPSLSTYDTLLLAASALGPYMAGESVDTLYSSHGCDSVVYRMVYAVECPADHWEEAPYGVSEVPFSPPEIVVAPSLEGLSMSVNAPPQLTVGIAEHVEWLLVAGTDTFECIGSALAEYPPCGNGYVATDGDGNVYETVRVGADCWLKGNVYSTHYAGTGSPIPVAEIFSADFVSDTVSNLWHYGRMYSWYSAVGLPENSTDPPLSNADGEVQGACPVGWHLPSRREIASLQSYDSPSLKATGNFWIGETPVNDSGFSMMPGGLYNAALARYEKLKTHAYIWTSDMESSLNGCAAYLQYICSELETVCFDKKNKCSVRCAKD